jgi:ABC-type Zn uptake system ZnuABC Zn-binding protein ZnuA
MKMSINIKRSNMNKKFYSIIVSATIFVLLLSACAAPAATSNQIHVVASTTIVGDVVNQIGGEHIQLTVLFPVGADPHTFEPRPQDVAAIADAKIIFLNGLELEHSLENILEANATGTIVEVSEGVEVLHFDSEHHEGEEEHHEGEEHGHADGDPHTWMDPNLVMIWVNNVEATLSELDPSNAADYAANAKNYLAELTELDAWIQTEVSKVPVENRKLVTDHHNMGYFIHRYNFELAGLVIDSLSTGASPSAQDLSALVDAIKEQNVKAIFVGSTVNPNLAEQISSDTGTTLVTIDTASLGGEGSDTATYIEFMKKMVTTIVNGLQ